MVVVHGWKSAPIGRSGLLKSIAALSKKVIAESPINLNDISVIIHGGVYRRNFRVEPAFATHVQDALGLKCTAMSLESRHCFSFDVSDGSCSPYVAFDAAKHMLKIKPGGYCLITLGDERPNAQSNWPYKPISCVMIVSLEGNGPRLTTTKYDLAGFDESTCVNMTYNEKKSKNVISTHNVIKPPTNLPDSMFVGEVNWLSGQQMHEFLSQLSPGATNIHQIIDQSGKIVTATWK